MSAVTLPPAPPTKYIPERSLRRWGACETRNNIIALFPGQPGVPVTVEAARIIFLSTLYPDPAQWYGHLLRSTARWARYREITEAELRGEMGNLLAACQEWADGRIDLAALRQRGFSGLEHFQAILRALDGVREPRRQAYGAVHTIVTYHRAWTNPNGEEAGNLASTLWMAEIVVRVIEEEALRDPDINIDPVPQGEGRNEQ